MMKEIQERWELSEKQQTWLLECTLQGIRFSSVVWGGGVGMGRSEAKAKVMGSESEGTDM